MTIPVHTLSNRQLKDEIGVITRMLGKGEVGTTLASRARIAAVLNEAARRMKPDRSGEPNDVAPSEVSHEH